MLRALLTVELTSGTFVAYSSRGEAVISVDLRAVLVAGFGFCAGNMRGG